MDAPGASAPEPEAGGEATGIDRFPCPTCGAECRYDPAAGTLACTRCDHRQAMPTADAEVIEYDLEATLRAAPRGETRPEARVVACTACGARVEVPAAASSLRCGYCAQPVVLAEDDPDRLAPGAVLPFAVAEGEARRNLRAWLESKWFRPKDLVREAEVQALRGRYVPSWTFDADTDSDWTAMAGHYYYVTESYTASENGKSVRKTRQVRKIRWVPAAGDYRHRYDDWMVWASRSLAPHLRDELGDWPFRRCVSYAPAYVAGHECERYTIDLRAGWGQAREEIAADIRSECARRVPGDTHRDLRVSTTWRDLRWKLCLLPLWIVAYRYRGKPYHLVVNGVSGKVDGEAPLSWARILGFILFLLVLGGAIAGVVVMVKSR